MSKRSYEQYCPVACGLDIIGERWTLLIVRELMFRPQRYTDLQRELPGIGTNLLAKRLQEMEACGLIVKRQLPPPAASTVYELTAAGRGLAPVVVSLARWGMQFMPDRPPEEMPVTALLRGMGVAMGGADASGVDLTVQFDVGGVPYHVVIRDQAVVPGEGPARSPVATVLVDDVRTLFLVVSRSADWAELEASGALRFEGDRDAALQVLCLLAITEEMSAAAPAPTA